MTFCFRDDRGWLKIVFLVPIERSNSPAVATFLFIICILGTSTVIIYTITYKYDEYQYNCDFVPQPNL